MMRREAPLYFHFSCENEECATPGSLMTAESGGGTPG